MYQKLLLFLAVLAGAFSVKAQTLSKADSLTLERMMQNLPEVMVKGSRPIVKAERGALSYNMPQLMKELPADNAYEAITRIPGVSSSEEGIQLFGNSVTLIINGKATTLTQEQLAERLKAMPAGQLAKAEVMLAAPARMHVRGHAINIVTKDYAGTNQTSGQIVGAYRQSKYSLGAAQGYLNMQRGKFGLDAQYQFSDGYTNAQVSHSANHPLSTGRAAYHDLTRNKNLDITHGYRLGMNYAFAKNHTIDLAYTGKWNKSCAENRTYGSATDTTHTDDHTYLHNFDLSYSLPFGLKLSGSYTYYRMPQRQRLNGAITSEETSEETERILTTSSKQTINKWMFAADQEHDLGKGWGLSYGVKAQFTSNKSWQATLDKQGQTMPDATSSADIFERIWNFYGGFSKQISQGLSIEASVEGEQYHSPRWNKWHVYPTLEALWTINPDNILNLSFSSNSTFPSYWSTMSTITYSSSYSEIWGNPGLKPYSNYDIGLMWQFKQRYTLTAFANLQPNFAIQLPYQTSERMAVIMKETNFNYSNTYGLQASAMFKFGKWVSGNAFAVGVYRHDKSDDFFDLPFNRHTFFGIFGTTTSVRLHPKQNLKLIINPFFQTNAIQGVYDIDPIFRINADLRWTSDNGKWNIILKGNNLLNSKINTTSTYRNQDFRMKVAQNWVTGTLSVIYKFGGYKEKQVKEVDTSRMGH